MARNRSRKAKSLRAARGSARKQNAGITSPERGSGLVMYSSPRAVMPPQYNTRLKYIIDTVVTNVAATQASVRYRTDAFDVDPTLGSTAMPGFTELAGLYARFRTTRLSYKFSVANQEAFTMAILHGFSRTSIASGSLNLQYAGNPLFRTSMLGPATGKGTGIYRGSSSIVGIYGTRQPMFDDIFTGSTTSSTLSANGTAYCYLGIISPVALTALGVNLVAEITLDVQFYAPTFILT